MRPEILTLSAQSVVKTAQTRAPETIPGRFFIQMNEQSGKNSIAEGFSFCKESEPTIMTV